MNYVRTDTSVTNSDGSYIEWVPVSNTQVLITNVVINKQDIPEEQNNNLTVKLVYEASDTIKELGYVSAVIPTQDNLHMKEFIRAGFVPRRDKEYTKARHAKDYKLLLFKNVTLLQPRGTW